MIRFFVVSIRLSKTAVFGIHLEQLIPHLDRLGVVLILERVGGILAVRLHGLLLGQGKVPGSRLVKRIDGQDLVQERRRLLELALPKERDDLLLQLLDPLHLLRRYGPGTGCDAEHGTDDKSKYFFHFVAPLTTVISIRRFFARSVSVSFV